MSIQQRVSKRVSNIQAQGLALIYLIISFVIPWGVGTTQSDIFGRFIHVNWWVFEVNYLPGEPIEVYPVGESLMYIGTPEIPVGMIAWHAGALLLSAGVLGALIIDIDTDWYEIPVSTAEYVGGVLALAGTAYCIGAIWFTTQGVSDVSVPVGAFVMLIGSIHLLKYKSGENTDTEEPANTVDTEST